jgi:hypothetical protein
MTLRTSLSKMSHYIQPRGRAMDVSISLNESVLKAIDSVRGDTNRSLWLRRLAIKELERLKKLEEVGGEE